MAAVKSVSENRWVSIRSNTIDDQINIQFSLPRKERVDVVLYDMSGKTVYKENFNIEPSMSLNVSGFSGLPKGTYIIKVQSAEGKFSMKMVK